VIRYDVDIRLESIGNDEARAAITTHHRDLAYSGDFFIPHHQLDATHREVRIDGVPVGVAAYTSDALTLLTLTGEAKRYDRQILERILAETGITQAYAASWDSHHVDLFGAFAAELSPQAYQFELGTTPPRDPVAGLSVRPAADSDLPYLRGTGFQDDYTVLLNNGQLRIAELAGIRVGIGVAVPHPLNDSTVPSGSAPQAPLRTVDIGMFTNADRRHEGIGRSILALVAREMLDTGCHPVAGCWWRNWESRRTLEAAGLTCIGTIFRLTLDPDRFTR